MKKKDYLLIATLILSILVLDQVSKQWALTELRVFGRWQTSFLGFFLHKNHGAMMGTFSDLPPILRIVSLATGGVFLIFIFTIIMSILQHRLLVLRTGLSILLGGILGNVMDRITHGPVTDFIVLKAYGRFSPAFNLADAIQWVGYAMVCYSIFKHGHLIWPDNNKRSQFWVDYKYQLKYCLTFVGFSAVFSLILGVFSFTFLKVMISESVRTAQAMSPQSLIPFVIVFSLVTLTFLLVIFMLGLRLSHRSVGPVFAFRSFINDLREGRTRNLKLRSHDEFKYLEEEARLLKRDYRHYRRLKNFLESLKRDNIIPIKSNETMSHSNELSSASEHTLALKKAE